jgi:hypothetical protein
VGDGGKHIICLMAILVFNLESYSLVNLRRVFRLKSIFKELQFPYHKSLNSKYFCNLRNVRALGFVFGGRECREEVF